MPQMAPLNWTLMLIMFSLTFILYNIMNFYSLKYNYKNMNLYNNKIKFINWKW
uniref:ATP synthase complex subunit 8 n=1 Tax=Georissidae sp. BMNH 840458 TaxID=1903816 RepID=A0A343A3J5_9COLE|nr:ATP synthase F0 subunit 8 [Georissidae sp. BMNH 840458]